VAEDQEARPRLPEIRTDRVDVLLLDGRDDPRPGSTSNGARRTVWPNNKRRVRAGPSPAGEPASASEPEHYPIGAPTACGEGPALGLIARFAGHPWAAANPSSRSSSIETAMLRARTRTMPMSVASRSGGRSAAKAFL